MNPFIVVYTILACVADVISCNLTQNKAVADPGLQIRGGGGAFIQTLR